jgi:outer membrane protein, heavy metal efflux system
MPTKAIFFTSLSGLTLLGGCAAVQPRQSFPAIEQSVSDATSYRVHWNSGGEADHAVTKHVQDMLAKPLDADTAVQIALLNNRHLQATYEELGVAQADLVGAGLLSNPVFDGSARFGHGGDPTIDLGIVFNFLDIFFVGLRKNVATAQLEVAKVNATSNVLSTAGDVKVAFYELLAAEQTVELRRQVEQATAASYDLAKRLREAGNNRPLDVSNERALYEESKLALASVEADAFLARENLGRLMGVWGRQTTWTTDGRLPDLPAEEVPAEGLEAMAVKNSLALRASRAQIAAALGELGITKPLGYLSELEVGASAERDAGDWEVGPSLTLPIPLFSQGQPAVARAQSRIRQAEQEYYATAVDVRSFVRTAYGRVRAAREQALYYRDVMLPLRQTIVDQTQLQYNAMQIGAFQLLQSKRDQVAAAATYLSLLRDYWTAKAELQLGLDGRVMGSASSERIGMGSGTPSMISTSSTGHWHEQRH